MSESTRRLGKTGPEVGPIAFGGNVFGWTADEATSFKLLDAAVDAGFNLIDTADVYSRWAPGHKGGESRNGHRQMVQENRQPRPKVVIATKVGMEMGPGEVGLSAAYIHKAVRAVAQPTADRSHRPLSIAQGRPDDAARRRRSGPSAT